MAMVVRKLLIGFRLTVGRRTNSFTVLLLDVSYLYKLDCVFFFIEHCFYNRAFSYARIQAYYFIQHGNLLSKSPHRLIHVCRIVLLSAVFMFRYA